jgi:regulator of sigma E protease
VSALSGFILVLLGFGFLIFIHELGHFLAAKWAGIRADGFAIGMGPCVLSYRRGIGLVAGSADAKVVRLHGKRPIEMTDAERESKGLGETEYSLRALPLGGYVRMLGQEDGNPEATSSDARSFGMATIPRRAVVILAGITANLVLAIVLFLIAFMVGVRFPAPTVGFVLPGSPAAKAAPTELGEAIGLQPGDTVLSIDGDETRTFIDLRVAAAMSKPGETLAFEVDRAGRTVAYTIAPERDPGSGLLSIGVDPARSSSLTDVRDSREDVARAVARLGLGDAARAVGSGWRVASVDGRAVQTFAELERAAQQSGGRALETVWESPDGARATLSLTPAPDFEVLRHADGKAADRGIIGLTPLPLVLEFASGSANTETLRAGDVLMRVGDLEGPSASQLVAHFRANPNTRFDATVLRDGSEVKTTIRTDRDGRAGLFLEGAWELPRLARSVDEVRSGNVGDEAGADPASRPTPAKMIGALPLASVLSLDGTPVANLRELRAALVSRATSSSGDAPVTVRLGLRDPSPEAVPHEVSATLGAQDLASLRALGHSFPIPETFFDPQFTILTANGNPWTAIQMGFRQTVVMVEQVFLTIDRVARGSVGADQLQGPVGILHTGTKVADEGFMYIVFFLALISVNLAVVNLLPIPIADGGLFVFLMYEKFAGRPPSIAFQNAAAMAGIALVAALFLFTFYNDLMRLFGA